MNSKRQGTLGVAAAIAYFTSMQHSVFLPLSDAQRYDLVVDISNILYRVEIKTSSSDTFWLRTMGGNQSGKGKIKFLSAQDCDLVFLHSVDGSSWLYTIEALEGKTSVKPTAEYKIGE